MSRESGKLLQRKYKGSDVPVLISMSYGVVFGAVFMVLVYVAGMIPVFKGVREIFFDRGFIQFLNVILGAWALGILFLKYRAIKQQRALATHIRDFAGFSGEFDLRATKKQLFEKIPNVSNSWLYQRIDRIEAYLDSAGSTKGLRETLREQSDRDADAVDVGYSILRVLIAVIPLVGFSGTVLGISASVGHFSGVIQIAKELDEVTRQLGGVTTGLAVAFDTTLLSLLITIPLMMLISALKKRDDEFLNEVDEYTELYIVDPLQNLDKREQTFEKVMLQISEDSLNNHSKALVQNTSVLHQLKDDYNTNQKALNQALDSYQQVGKDLKEMVAAQEQWTEKLQLTKDITNNFELIFKAIGALPKALESVVVRSGDHQREELRAQLKVLNQTLEKKDGQTQQMLKEGLNIEQENQKQYNALLKQINQSLNDLRKPLETLSQPVTVTLARDRKE